MCGIPFRVLFESSAAAGASADCVDHYRCRFVTRDGAADLADSILLELIGKISARHRWVHAEKLQYFDGIPAYTKAQGED